jgi:hypothetical protein
MPCAYSARPAHGAGSDAAARPTDSRAAVALNLIRLDAWRNGNPLDRTRSSHLARLDLSLTA